MRAGSQGQDIRGVAPDLRITLLGAFNVAVGPRLIEDREWRLRKTKNLIKLLVLAPGHRLHREHLIDLLWPEQDPGLASNNLNKAVHRARHVLEPGLPPATRSRYLHLEDDSLILRPPGELWVDVEQFEQVASRARNSGSPEVYAEALRYYSGDLLPEDRYEDWAVGRREELRSLYLRLLLDLARIQERAGDPAAAADLLRKVVASDPAHEEAQVALMRLHAQMGHRHQALRQFRQLREALRRELDVEPDPVTQQLYDAIAGGQAPTGSSPKPQSASQFLSSSVRKDVRTPMRPPLVGRDAELEVLENLLDTLFTGQGRTVLVAGEAGIGKSRLVVEIAERLQSRGGTALMGAAYEHEGRLSFGPFVEALGTFDTGNGVGGLQAIFGDALHDFSRLPPPGASAIQTDRERFFYGIAQLLRHRAVDGPLLLTLDDLHAADDASLELLHYLARTTRNDPVLLLATFRPEDAPAASKLSQLVGALQRESLAVRLNLRRFVPSEVDLFVATLLEEQPVDRGVFDAIYRTADGNPFFTSEIVRGLQENGELRQVDGRWLLLAENVPISGSIADLLIGRMERLGPEVMQLLNLGSVIGRDISFSVLRAAGNLADGAVLDTLDLCLVHHILEETDEGYRFCHPLQRTVLYERLSHARRTHLHGRVAETLELLHTGSLDHHAEALAYHWARSEQPERAVPFLIQSGDRAASLYANDAAIGYYQEALQRLRRQEAAEPAIARLEEKMGTVMVTAGRYDEALEHLGRASEWAQSRGDLEGASRVTAHMGTAHRYLGSVEEGIALVSSMIDLLVRSGPSESLASLYISLATLSLRVGRYQLQLEAAERAVEVSRSIGSDRLLGEAEERQATALSYLGAVEDALRVYEEAIPLITAGGDLEVLSRAITNAAICCWLLGRLPACNAYYQRSIEVTERVGNRERLAFTLASRASVLYIMGDWAGARETLERAVVLVGGQQTEGAAATLIHLGRLALFQGDWQEAGRRLTEGLALGRQVGTQGFVDYALTYLAERDVVTGRPGSAIARLEAVAAKEGAVLLGLVMLAWAEFEAGMLDRAAATVARSVHRAREEGEMHPLVEALRVQGMVLHRQGQMEEACATLEEALERARRLPYPYAEARILEQLGRVAGSQSASEVAREQLEAALAIFRRLGAKKDGERIARELSDLASR